MATPQVPPRPTRSRQAAPAVAAEPAPRVPPRPAGRRKDISPSPDRYAPSPLNHVPRKPSSSGLYSNAKQNQSSTSVDPPSRPPSVSLPTLGQEGSEYADLALHELHQNELDQAKTELSTTTSHVDSELPLHAPKPALSKSSAKAQVAAVTRTDSSQAAEALGITSPPRDDPDPYGRPLKSKTSSGYIRSGSALSADRPPSASQLDEHGIPQIGRHVPLLFNAGDVQAPSPALAPQSDPMSESIEDLRQPRHHRRKHSGREVFHGPPGSYGLHGHGAAHNDMFEKSWYAKHPEELVKEEQGHYGSALSGTRPEFALSSEDLNKLVRSSGKGAGIGTARTIVGLPDEQIGYMATEEYANRMKSPRSHAGKHRPAASQTHVESPLRRTSFPQDSLDARMIPANKNATAIDDQDDTKEDVIHIDPPEDPINKITGEGVESRESFGHRRSSSDADRAHAYAEEHGYHAPILASDEHTPGAEWQQPAMSPSFPPDRRGSAQLDDFGGLHRHLSHLGGSASSSRAGSRPGSIHGIPALSKIHSHDNHEDRHTPLEDVEEYEPLFPDDDGKLKKAITQADRFKQRPDMRQRFPSQDIWEDTPDSLRLEAEVTSPEPAEQRLQAESAAETSVDTRPEIRSAPPVQGGVQFSPNEELRARSGYSAGLQKRGFAAMSQRFPSRDIWEDSPDSAALTTEVMDLEDEEEDENATAIVDNEGIDNAHPGVPPRPVRARGSGASQEAASHPQVPPRPPQKKPSTDSAESGVSDARRPPSIPDRPKPQIPLRPSKSVSRDSIEGAPLSKSISTGSTGSQGDDGARSQKPPPPAVKAKPSVPMRPAGGKIAALQADFMADLNSRLKIGPTAQQSPQKEEAAPEEKQPLQDARKGRARGPTRRKPGAAAATEEADGKSSVAELGFSTVWTVCHSEPDGSIVVPSLSEASIDKVKIAPEEDVKQTKPDLPDMVEKETLVVASEPETLPQKSPSLLSDQAVRRGDEEPELATTAAKEDLPAQLGGQDLVASLEDKAQNLSHPEVEALNDADPPLGANASTATTNESAIAPAEDIKTDSIAKAAQPVADLGATDTSEVPGAFPSTQSEQGDVEPESKESIIPSVKATTAVESTGGAESKP